MQIQSRRLPRPLRQCGARWSCDGVLMDDAAVIIAPVSGHRELRKLPLPKTALVVETNYLIASVIESPLIASGFQVVVATDEDEARTAIATHGFDIAILDFRLQHGGPEGLVAQLQVAGIPYVFCTASSTAEVVEHFPGARVIEKPFGDDMLLFIVTDVIAGAEAPRA